MKVRLIFLFGFIFFFLLSFNTHTNAESNPSMVLTKVLMNPTSCDDNDCEWIEIYNNSDSNVDLADWKYNDIQMNSYSLPSKQSLLIARELIDGEDTDDYSFESNWGNNSGVWGDDLSENYLAIDDGDLGISINLGNSSGVVVLSNIHNSDESNFSWDNSNYIGYKYELISSQWIGVEEEVELIPGFEETNDPLLELKVKFNGSFIENNSELNLDSDIYEIDLGYSVKSDSNFLTFSTNIKQDNNVVFQSSDTKFSYNFSSTGDYFVESVLIDFYGSVQTLTFKVSVNQPTESYLVFKFNELLPDPSKIDWNNDGTISDASDEWIEFYNPNDTPVNILNYYIADESSKNNPKKFTSDKFIPAHGYLVVFSSEIGISLNNSNESVYLYDPDLNLIDTFTYSSSKPDNSYYRKSDGEWDSTNSPTFEAENVQISDEGNDENTDEDDDPNQSPEYTELDLSKDTLSEYIGDKIKIDGVVSVDKDLLGKNQFYVQKGDKAIRVSLSNNVDLNIKMGYLLELIGELKQSANSELYLFIDSSEGIIVKSKKEKVTTNETKINQVTEDSVGTVVSIKGVIVETSGSTFWIGQGSDRIKVRVKDSTGIKLARKSKGDFASVTGILAVDEVNGDDVTYVIYPRYASDVAIGEVNGASTLANTGTSLILLIMGAFVIFGISLMILLRQMKYNIRNKLLYSMDAQSK